MSDDLKSDDGDIAPVEGNLLEQPKEATGPRNPLMKVRTYVLALRPWSLSASFLPTLLGAALAYRLPGDDSFSWLTFLLTLCTVIPVHGAGNVINTYFDFVKGIDNRKSDDRTLVDHILSIDEVVSLGALFNNTRDLETDSKAEIVTLAILIGKTASLLLYAFLLFTPYIMFVVASVRCSMWFLLPMLTLPRAFEIERMFRRPESMRLPFLLR
ncbi:hypothetical protein JYU34_001544 [Plutella xylostella]|uniref:UbiA prenyltransferase domain-containing protein 1 n=1 Tax=Plutella xylostella TaxID=51655 RepID=A0ABQ7R463_PLUXY|nr:hypothetical protein JYU34_001544 [Plutella xylostella]